MIKILIGGSPCTHWSIAQNKNRETTAAGTGWELFRNYLIAKEKFRPDLFLYENNKSAAQAIKDQISEELDAPLQYINSALVSAQNRQRFYVHNFRDVPPPEDKGILLKDILEDGGTSWQEKSYALTTRCAGAIPSDTQSKHRHTMVAGSVRIGTIESSAKNPEHDSQQYRVYSPYGKAVTLCGQGGGVGAKTGLYATPAGKDITGETVYEVRNGGIEVKGELYPIKLPDGFYIIRKLTPIECERLQTLPDNYTAAVSNAQRYKGLGNGWTAEVIIHLLRHALAGVPRHEKIVVLSMYDGIGTGRYCFDKLGFGNVEYYAYEVDKYAMRVANSNYPDIVQCGDAFQVQRDSWGIMSRGRTA